MMQEYKIEYTDDAILDIDEVFSYIALDDIDAAENMFMKIDEGISKLGSFPYVGIVLNEDDYPLLESGYRYIVIKPYIVLYRVVKEQVIIARILHSRRDYLRELFS